MANFLGRTCGRQKAGYALLAPTLSCHQDTVRRKHQTCFSSKDYSYLQCTLNETKHTFLSILIYILQRFCCSFFYCFNSHIATARELLCELSTCRFIANISSNTVTWCHTTSELKHGRKSQDGWNDYLSAACTHPLSSQPSSL